MNIFAWNSALKNQQKKQTNIAFKKHKKTKTVWLWIYLTTSKMHTVINI